MHSQPGGNWFGGPGGAEVGPGANWPYPGGISPEPGEIMFPWNFTLHRLPTVAWDKCDSDR